jgi:hypothetical protein
MNETTQLISASHDPKLKFVSNFLNHLLGNHRRAIEEPRIPFLP